MSRGVIIVTGATSGLGLELSEALAAKGDLVIGISRTLETSGRFKSLLESEQAHHIAGNVADPSTVEAAFQLSRDCGKLKMVINCAGVGVFGPVGSYSKSHIDEALNGNLIGTILFSEAAYREFKVGGGTIVNIMSTAANTPRQNEAVYCAAKSGAKAYTESIRLEAKGTKVRVIAVYPGGMNTPFWAHSHGNTGADSAKFAKPAEVASVVVEILKAKESSYVSDIVI